MTSSLTFGSKLLIALYFVVNGTLVRVPYAIVERQGRRNFPIVLNIEAVHIGPGSQLVNSDWNKVRICVTSQETGEGIAGSRCDCAIRL